MRATVILNENAGTASNVDGDRLARALCDAGYRAETRATADVDELGAVLDDTEGLVVCVGGDGTLRETVLRLRDRDRPLALVPMGTANNVAASLGVDRERDPYDMLRRLAEPRRCAFDLGRVTTARGESLFLEACGLGLYAKLLDDYHPEDGKDVLRAIDSVRGVVVDFEPFPLTVDAGGERHDGPFVLATVMNTARMGLRIPFAPDASPCDGLLDLVLIHHEEGRPLLEYATRLARGTLEEAPNVQRLQVRSCRIASRGSPFHVDDRVHRIPAVPGESGSDAETAGAATAGEGPAASELTIDVLAGAVDVWLPAPERR